MWCAQLHETLWNSPWGGQDETVSWDQEVPRMLGHSNSYTRLVSTLEQAYLRWPTLDPATLPICRYPEGTPVRAYNDMHGTLLTALLLILANLLSSWRTKARESGRDGSTRDHMKAIGGHDYEQVLDVSEYGADRKNRLFWLQPRSTAQVQMWRFK